MPVTLKELLNQAPKREALAVETPSKYPCLATPGCLNNAHVLPLKEGRSDWLYKVDGKPACTDCYDRYISNLEVTAGRGIPHGGCHGIE